MQCRIAWALWAAEPLSSSASLPVGGRCGVVCCGVVCRAVPKVLLPKGKGRDASPRVKVNVRNVCLARAPCLIVWLSVEGGVLGVPGCNAPWYCCHRTISHVYLWQAHPIVLLGPRRAFRNVARALAWEY